MQQMKDLIELFSTRLLHDLLNPVGTLQLAIDNWQQEQTKESTDLLENSMYNIIYSLDLLRKAYGYKTMNLDDTQLRKLAENVFGDQVQIKGDINGKWIIHIIRCLVWLKYKMLSNSKAIIEIMNNNLHITITDVYLTDQEYDLINDKKNINSISLDAYLIYLFLFISKLEPDIQTYIEKEEKKYCLRLVV